MVHLRREKERHFFTVELVVVVGFDFFTMERVKLGKRPVHLAWSGEASSFSYRMAPFSGLVAKHASLSSFSVKSG